MKTLHMVLVTRITDKFATELRKTGLNPTLVDKSVYITDPFAKGKDKKRHFKTKEMGISI